MPTIIKRKIKQPPIFTGNDTCENSVYGNDTNECYKQLKDVVISFPNGNCCQEVVNNNINIVYTNGQCCDNKN